MYIHMYKYMYIHVHMHIRIPIHIHIYIYICQHNVNTYTNLNYKNGEAAGICWKKGARTEALETGAPNMDASIGVHHQTCIVYTGSPIF